MKLLKQLVIIESSRDTHPLKILQREMGDDYWCDIMDETLIIYTSRDATEETDPCVEVQYDEHDEVLEISESAGDPRPDITSLYSGSDPEIIAKLRAKAREKHSTIGTKLTNRQRFKKVSTFSTEEDDAHKFDFDFDNIADNIKDRLYHLASLMKSFR